MRRDCGATSFLWSFWLGWGMGALLGLIALAFLKRGN